MQQYKCSSPKHKYDQLGMSEDICDDMSYAHDDKPTLDSSVKWEDMVAHVTVENGVPELVLKVLHDYFWEVQYIPQVIK